MRRARAVRMLSAGLLVGLATGAHAVPPAEDFLLHCAGCHGVEGRGARVVPGLLGLAPLLDAPGGRAYLVRVPGVAQAPLGDARLAELLNWVLRELSGRRPDPPFTASEVGPLRGAPLRDPLAERPIPPAEPLVARPIPLAEDP